jgi:hypothetical protein
MGSNMGWVVIAGIVILGVVFAIAGMHKDYIWRSNGWKK